MSDEARRGISQMLAELQNDSIGNNMYSLKHQLVFGDPLPLQNYTIDPLRFRNANETLKADALSHTPKEASFFPQDIIDFYGLSYSPTKFPSVPKRLTIRNDIVPSHLPRKDGTLGEFLLPALRPLMDGDDKKALATKKQTPFNQFPCPLCYGHSYMDVCHTYPTVGMRMTRLRDINYTLFLEGMHQVCPRCLKREYGHVSHADCTARLSCSFCRSPGHDSTICTSAAHVSSLGDRFRVEGELSRRQICETILSIDMFNDADIKTKHRQRRRRILTRLASISNALNLKVFPPASMYLPVIRDAVPPRWGLNLSVFKPVSAERAKKTAADLARSNDHLPEVVNDIAECFVLPRQEQNIQDDINEPAGPEQAPEPDVPEAVGLPREENSVNDNVDVEQAEIVEQPGATENPTQQVAEHAIHEEFILPQKNDTVQPDILNDMLDAHLAEIEDQNGGNEIPTQQVDSDIPMEAILPLQNDVQSDSESVMDDEQYQSYIEHPDDNEVVDPVDDIKDIFEEKKDDDGPQF